MTAFTGIVVTIGRFATRFLPVLLTCGLKASLAFAAVYAATRLMSKASPQLRHLLWLFAIGSYPFILALSLDRPLLLLGEWPGFHSGGSAIVSSLLFSTFDAKQVLALMARAAVQATGGSTPAVCWSTAWPAAVLSVWVVGVLATFARILLSRLEMIRLVGAAGRRFPRETLTTHAGLGRRVRLLESPRCRVPFTCRLLQPIVVLPAAMHRWSGERRRAVLLHELRHIRRGDCVTQTLAYAACCLFWFVPFIWAAYARLRLEQEKSCDCGVVAQGVERAAYADCVLEAARLARKPALFAGLGFAGRRKRILADRVRNILQGGEPGHRGWTVFAAAALLVCALVILGGAGTQKSLSDEEIWGRLAGTWVNETYAGFSESQKVVIKPGFLAEDWEFARNAERTAEWKVSVKKSWTDWKGDLYCQYFWRYTEKYPWTGMGLIRVNRTGKVLELLSRKGPENGEYPTVIDRSARSCEKDWYCIYYLR
jgi:beta-lactamase regulating signal transducer with metallopeptidase domain